MTLPNYPKAAVREKDCMTVIAELTPAFAVAPQIVPSDMARLAEAGFTTIVCNRADGEEAGQPDAAAMRRAAEDAGLSFHHIPVQGGMFSPSAMTALVAAHDPAGGRSLAYCRSGTRSAALYVLANPEGLTADERIAAAGRAGYDLESLRGYLAD